MRMQLQRVRERRRDQDELALDERTALRMYGRRRMKRPDLVQRTVHMILDRLMLEALVFLLAPLHTDAI